MENIVRTVYGSFLQTCKLFELPFTVLANSTLNEKFSVQQGVLPDIATIPKLAYWAIGNGGHINSIGTGGASKTEPVQHEAVDAALYHHLPFVLRPLTNDIASGLRAKYAMRRIETHNAVQHAAYYLRRMDFTDVEPTMLSVSIVDGVSTSSAFIPSSSNLNPTPPDVIPDEVTLVNGDFVSASAQLNLSLTAAELAEFVNAVNIIYGDDNYAIISEIALVTGLDKTVTSPAQSGTINFNEVIVAQAASFVNTYFAAKFANDGISVLLDVGATEPLFNIS